MLLLLQALDAFRTSSLTAVVIAFNVWQRTSSNTRTYLKEVLYVPCYMGFRVLRI